MANRWIAVAITVIAGTFAGTGTATAEPGRVIVPLMGPRGDLAVLSASPDLVRLAKVRTAVEQDGVVLYDRHSRQAGFETDNGKHYLEAVSRMRVDCNQMQYRVLSSVTQNFQTGEKADRQLNLPNNTPPEPLKRTSPEYGICAAINSGNSLFSALTRHHINELKVFPRFAFPYHDAFIVDEVSENGEPAQVSESVLLQHLKKSNPTLYRDLHD
ncbi:MAG: hypothetical protein MI794_04470 [Pseudomonadales bacterium]|nr:hypothetical protein [Pseudomonadales bacterium]